MTPNNLSLSKQEVSKYNHLMVCLKASWAALICCTHQHYTTASDCQTPSGQIPRYDPEQGIGGYGGKEFERRNSIAELEK